MSEKTPSLNFSGPDTGYFGSNEFVLTAVLEGKEIGKFWFDENTKTFHFDGDVDESAKLFIADLENYMNSWFEARLKSSD